MARVKGYMFTVTGFLRVDADDIDKQLAALQAVKDAKNGDLAIVKKLEGVKVKAKQTSADEADLTPPKPKNKGNKGQGDQGGGQDGGAQGSQA